ncbi:hypothetical protein M0657_012017 [Pyricularia oryzae]|uniref:Uncharacterized protein n=1 Tax=Pyricularia oryzae (strain Y34) TaxID=1143189 RepID=A0AA97NNH3_PYRO3|nr:hypothetical protein OOU_Y34scaffold00947g2 [Pyricularia oryzae Y34]KAI7909023.1 hypothetical protein M0657_012017 [Pyricularia oryzae]
MQLKTIAVSLGLFALHASAEINCKVELLAKNPVAYAPAITIQPAVFVRPGRSGSFETADYTLNFETIADCRFIENYTLTGVIRYDKWELVISRVDV